MSKKKQRIDTSPGSTPLTSNPFANLRQQLPDDLLQQADEQPKEPPKAEILQQHTLPYRIQKTRKGGYNIAFHRRAKGSGVTILKGVEGDSKALLKALKQKLGTGGAATEDTIEIQGNHMKAIEHFLKEKGA